MLRILREHATSWMLRGILILVAVTFISWGGFYLLREEKHSYVAKVDGKIIGEREYNEHYQSAIRQYREALGPSFSEKFLEEIHLKEKVLDQLIDKILILQEAKRLGLTVSDEELREAIESFPAFQVNGQFDKRQYERFLRLNRLTPEEFEQMQRESLLFSKLVHLIKSNGGKVSDQELFEIYLFENERINLNFIRVTPESFKKTVTANEIELKDYFQKHSEEFRIPTFAQIQYLTFRPSDFEGKVQISPEEIKRYYDSRKEQFMIPKQVKAREILIKLGGQETPEQVEEKRKKAEAILEKAKKTKDFASVARQYSESNSAPKGGDIGWVQKGLIEESLEKILFSLKSGEVSGVVRGSSGFFIFKAEEVKEEREKPLEEVKEQVRQTLIKEKAKSVASREAEDAFYSLFRSRDLENYAKEKGLLLKTTGFFKEGEEVSEFGKNPNFHSNVFSLKVGEISPVVSIPPNFYLLKMVNKKESRIPSFNEVKEEVQRKVIEMKAEEKARQTAEELLNQMKKGRPLGELGREKGFPIEETGPFLRNAPVIPKIGPAKDSMEILSSLSEKNRIPKEVIRTKEGFFVVSLLDLEPADPNRFPLVKKNLEKRVVYQKQEEFYQNWLKDLKNRAKIEIDKKRL
ncbi:MAG: SurA N-terminal domain-containing protein [Thermodesulfobacteriota bacterium]